MPEPILSDIPPAAEAGRRGETASSAFRERGGRPGLRRPHALRLRWVFPGRLGSFAGGAAASPSPGVSGRGARAPTHAILLEELGPTYVKMGQIVSSQVTCCPSALGGRARAPAERTFPPFPFLTARQARGVSSPSSRPLRGSSRTFSEKPLGRASLPRCTGPVCTTHARSSSRSSVRPRPTRSAADLGITRTMVGDEARARSRPAVGHAAGSLTSSAPTSSRSSTTTPRPTTTRSLQLESLGVFRPRPAPEPVVPPRPHDGLRLRGRDLERRRAARRRHRPGVSPIARSGLRSRCSSSTGSSTATLTRGMSTSRHGRDHVPRPGHGRRADAPATRAVHQPARRAGNKDVSGLAQALRSLSEPFRKSTNRPTTAISSAGWDASWTRGRTCRLRSS